MPEMDKQGVSMSCIYICVVHLAIFVLVIQTASASVVRNSENLDEIFKLFVEKYKKNYTSCEYESKKGNFIDNLFKAARLSLQDKGTARYGITRYADSPPPTAGAPDSGPKNLSTAPDVGAIKFEDAWNELLTEEGMNQTKLEESLPSQFDWREKGMVGPIVDQGNVE